MAKHQKIITAQQKEILEILEARFTKYAKNFQAVSWEMVKDKLLTNPEKLWSLIQMENTGGAPNLVNFDEESQLLVFYDCSPETPIGRRSICYDKAALDTRKEFKPATAAIDMANEMGVQLLSEQEYLFLQTLGNFDTKTSSWILTPNAVRTLGGALFADYRFGRTFVYHNGASSYYNNRGFRAVLKV